MNLEIADAMATGIPVGPGQVAHCDLCGVCLRPNHRVEVLFVIHGADITPVVTRCAHCAKDELHPQTARPCWLARGRLAASIGANDRSQLILSGAEVIDRTE